MTILSAFMKPEDLSEDIFYQFTAILGEESSEQLQEIIQNFRAYAEDVVTTILVSLFLVFISTNLFLLIRKSINQLWNIKVKKSPGMWVIVRSRLTGLLLLLAGGVVLLISLLADAAVAFIGDGLEYIIPDIGLPVISAVNNAFSMLIITIWLSLLYKILPNAEIQWRPAIVGGFITALLFTIGKLIIGFFLVNSDIGNIFGAAGSLILILLFLFYSFLIFYFGATYTKHYGAYIDQPIKADKYSEERNT